MVVHHGSWVYCATQHEKKVDIQKLYSIFVKQKELAGGVISWECSKRRNARSCQAKVDFCSLKTRFVMTTQAQTSDDQTQAIIGVNTHQFSEEERENLPSLETMRRSVWCAREGDNPPSPPAVNRGFVILPEDQNMENRDLFLQYDSNDPSNDLVLLKFTGIGTYEDWL